MPDITPRLPKGSDIIFNHLGDGPYASTVEDVFAAHLPGGDGLYIDAGWYVDPNGTGTFVVRSYKENNDIPLRPVAEASDIFSAVRAIEKVARETRHSVN